MAGLLVEDHDLVHMAVHRSQGVRDPGPFVLDEVEGRYSHFPISRAAFSSTASINHTSNSRLLTPLFSPPKKRHSNKGKRSRLSPMASSLGTPQKTDLWQSGSLAMRLLFMLTVKNS